MRLITKSFTFPIILICLSMVSLTIKIAAQQNDPFNADVDSPIQAMTLQANGKILIGGLFNNVSGQVHNHLARLNADGTLDPAFQNTNINVGIFVIKVQSDGKILVGGDFRYIINGKEYNNLVRFNTDGSLDSGFNPIVNKYIWAIVPQTDGRILIGGEFTTVGGQTRNKIARLNEDGSIDETFQDAGITSTIYGPNR